jgi:formylglycine-generating enzyme required for sulfatase activity
MRKVAVACGVVLVLTSCQWKGGEEPEGMVRIPAGEFTMGCSPGDGECQTDEEPPHKVWVSEFFMDATAVTVAQYRECVEAARCSRPRGYPEGYCTYFFSGRDQLPVTCVDWNQAKGYCEWAGKRLPTEAEWEKAARAGMTGSRYEELDQVAWYDKNSDGSIHPVGKKQPNAFGLYDMLGNVWEWCSDRYGEAYYEESPGRDPSGPGSGQYRVQRGGAWRDAPRNVRVSNRYWALPDYWSDDRGFRCAGSADIGP